MKGLEFFPVKFSQTLKFYVFRISCFLWLIGLAFTMHTLMTLLHNYVQYDSIVTESSYINGTPPFPEITVCAERMHSLLKGFDIFIFNMRKKLNSND